VIAVAEARQAASDVGVRQANVIYPLQYLRAVAAFSVVLCHASYYVKDVRGDGRMWEIFDRAGGLGVALFFAISGYLMAHLARTTSPVKFLVHRLVRIYPIYWLCVLLVVLAGIPFGRFIWPDVSALLLIPGLTQSYVLGVEWTLPFELAFYVIVFLVMAAGLARKLPIIALVWIALIQVFLVFRPELQQGQFPGLFHLPLSAFSLPFAMGLIVPWVVQRRWVGSATPLLGLAFLVLSESMVSMSLGLFYGFSALGCTLLVAWAVRPQAGSREPNAPLAALGDWSYALYLCHAPIIIALCKVMPESVGTMQLWFAAVGLPIVAVVALGKVDIWLYRILRRRVDGSSHAFKRRLCIVFLSIVVSISAFTYYRSFQNAIAAQNIEPTGMRIAEAMAGNHTEANLKVAAEQAGLKLSAKLRGHFDGVYRQPKEIRVHGWAADTRGGDVDVLIFHCGQYLGLATRSDSRPDVAKSLGLQDQDTGFTTNLPVTADCGAVRVDGLVLGPDADFVVMSAELK
jgi:exopolysaccharide production protein ExoZ